MTVPADTPSAGAPSAGAPSADGGSPSSSPSTPNPPSAGATAALQAALAAEHAAVYAFGVVGAKVPPGPKRDEARAGYAAHQARRDAWQRILAAAGATPAAAAPGYQLPFAVPDPAAAGRLAAEVESRLTAVYADLVAAGSGGLRMTAATALRECVLQCAHWGGASTALPGLAEPAASPSAGSASASGSPR
ncbi:ferritin-like domain-containing protein [Kitasatospora azatica]|uniref:ferritin-like domain-containing protein n=1 Tax=Kitasatospora azatica TaxID=58347 RepID=UPI0012FA0195